MSSKLQCHIAALFANGNIALTVAMLMCHQQPKTRPTWTTASSQHAQHHHPSSRLGHRGFDCCAGSLRELTLTGLPQLQHLRVTQQLPRSEPSVTVKCKALRLPYSLLSFLLTVSTPSLDLGEQLSALASLPQLESVGLHGPVLEKIPALPTTVTRYRSSTGPQALDCH